MHEKWIQARAGSFDIKIVKSPSDTTIYTPTLRKQNHAHFIIIPQLNQEMIERGINDNTSNFVESIHNNQRRVEQQQLMEKERRLSSELVIPGCQEAEERASQAIIEAEKFKASIAELGTSLDKHNSLLVEQLASGVNNIEMLPGPFLTQNEAIPNIRSGVRDDDFFQLTCHTERSLIKKIE